MSNFELGNFTAGVCAGAILPIIFSIVFYRLGCRKACKEINYKQVKTRLEFLEKYCDKNEIDKEKK